MTPATADVLERPAQQALERGRRTLEKVFSKARGRKLGALQSTTNEATFLIAAARLAVESGLVGEDEAEHGFHEARLRGLARVVFFLSRNRFFGNRTAVDALKAGKIEEVVAEAGSYLEHGS